LAGTLAAKAKAPRWNRPPPGKTSAVMDTTLPWG
jgi:hypothetical protein